MRIAMISYWTCPLAKLGVSTGGGLNVYVLNLANALGKLGHTVDIYTRTHAQEDDQRAVVVEGVEVRHIPALCESPYEDIEGYAKRVIADACKRGVRYDILHAHYFFSGLVGIEVRKQLGIPLVVTFHTLGVMKRQYAGIADTRRIVAESAIVAAADRIVVSTESEHVDLVERHHAPASKIAIVHPGLDHELFRPFDKAHARRLLGLRQDENLLLFVGRIDPVKGINTLIDAFGRLLKQHPDTLDRTKLLVIGGDSENERFWKSGEGRKIRQAICDRQLEDHIRLIGSRPHAELACYYAAVDLVVMPSKYETFGFVALEAMACGTCVVASRVGGLRSLIQDRHNGRLFEPGNSADLAGIMGELLLDPERRHELGQRAALSSQRYNWPAQAEKMLAVYKSCIARPGTRAETSEHAWCA